MRRIVQIVAALVFLGVVASGFALNFTASRIEFRGLQRIPLSTAESYLSVRVGSHISDAVADDIINRLYKTGFFSNVSVSQQGNALVVSVSERPVISKIVISGNKLVKTKQLQSVLKRANVAQGYEYNRSTLKGLKSALLSQYYAHGKYNARVNINVTKLPKNSVALYINISEGLSAVIKQIKIIGHHEFSERTLLGQFKLTTPGLMTFINHRDQYSSDQFAADLESLKAYYLNRGYLKFKILSTQVSLSPDRKYVYISVRISEGPQYHFSGFDITGRLIVPKAKLMKMVQFKKGDVYSKQKIADTELAVGDALGEHGYYWAKIVPQPKVNAANKTIFINLNVRPGKQVYVRHIIFQGNGSTDDNAFRRMLTQFEGGLVSTQRIRDSKQSMLQMPFVRDVTVDAVPVAGSNNKVDLNYKVTTVPAGEVKAGVGYSDVDGILLNAGVNQQNFFGTGNSFGVNVSYSKSMLQANINYFNPYYTTWGVGRGFSVYGSHYNADAANLADYATDNYGASVNYSIPMAQHDWLQFGFGIDSLFLKLSNDADPLMKQFTKSHGKTFYQIPVNLGWTHSDLDRAVFPTRGFWNSLGASVSVPVSNQSLEYYKFTESAKFYHPIYHDFIGKMRFDTGYGNGYGGYKRLPFFKNFYAGGISSVRGYNANTIGPQDSNGDSIGGNLLFDASASVIFPNPFSHTLRTSVFVDGGNVYDTNASQINKLYAKQKPPRAYRRDNNGLRYSAGMEFDWMSPMGLLNFAVAKAINPGKLDSTTYFQFNIGTTF